MDCVVLEVPVESSYFWDDQGASSLEYSKFTLGYLRAGLELASIFYAIFVSIDSFWVAHLVVFPHSIVRISVGEFHFSLAGSSPIEQLTLIDIT